MSFAKVDLYFALACRMDSGSATSSCGSWPKLLAVAATIRRAWRLLTPVLSRAPTRSGDRTDFVPRVLNRFGEKRPRRRKKKSMCWQRLAGLDDSDDDDSSSTSLLLLASVDGYVRESFHVGKPILFSFLSRPAIEPRLPFSRWERRNSLSSGMVIRVRVSEWAMSKSADETGFYYRSIPEKTLASEKEKSVPGCKLCKSCVSVMCCANTAGIHHLTSVVIGKAEQPCCLSGIMNNLPVVYDHSKMAWLIAKISKDWFYKHLVPEIINFQTGVLHYSHDRVRALLLDNAPTQPVESELVGDKGRIRVMYLPPNTTSLIQPMDQGILVAMKRLYRQRFLEQVMVVIDEEDRYVGQLTLDNLRKYDLKSVIFNLTRAWKDVSARSLSNGWNCLICGTDPVIEYEGFETADFHRHIVQAGETATEEDVSDWLDGDEGDLEYQTLTDAEIAC
ncbi:Tigger transposable element-derived protein 7 [Chionoecetes opilio]|uniref:Tigger transposable element-derived protein 7 n=1 Tax=Chionoecetes opilio TaxID=41210 RepID=A0A8J5CRS8_CHIOP|nr:Tigger transposable element-derived protein 7 [Chionoecetes opilio]